MIKISIIGCGKIAGIIKDKSIHTHAEAIKSNKRTKLVSCFDVSSSKSKKFSNNYACKDERSIRDILTKTRPDVISLCTPDETHIKIIKQIITQQVDLKILFVEKPICTTRYDYKHILDQSRNLQFKIIINHSRRFDSGHRELKKLIQQNKFGKIIRCDAFYYSGWLHNAIHVIDSINYLFDKKLKILKIHDYKKSKYKFDISVDIDILLSGYNSIISLKTFDEKFFQILELDLKFEKGRIQILDFGKKILVEKKIKNKIKENILIDYQIKRSPDISPIENAYNDICNYLIKKNEKYIINETIEKSQKTMNFMWDVMDKVRKYD